MPSDRLHCGDEFERATGSSGSTAGLRELDLVAADLSVELAWHTADDQARHGRPLPVACHGQLPSASSRYFTVPKLASRYKPKTQSGSPAVRLGGWRYIARRLRQSSASDLNAGVIAQAALRRVIEYAVRCFYGRTT
jgi:hypothetical protein